MNIARDFDGFMTLVYFVLFRHADLFGHCINRSSPNFRHVHRR
jgi:hypothetical protein